jgi:peptidyl-prolyl cis-trans isomerase A (cyclophilin A)
MDKPNTPVTITQVELSEKPPKGVSAAPAPAKGKGGAKKAAEKK